jgi:histidinol phosphatase-like PHP family hydrolase
MYNLHCHSVLSDGVLLPSEIARRYEDKGYKAIAITDHVDYSNIDFVVSSILDFTKHWPASARIKVLPGIELTHLPLEQFWELSKYARKEGIKIIIGHGETPAEPVIPGTNRACLEADIDILAHPGLISDEDVKLAKEKDIFLEITSRLGHSNTNIHVAERALKFGAKLILDIDSHMPEDIITLDKLRQVAVESGLTPGEIDSIYLEVSSFIEAILKTQSRQEASVTKKKAFN